MRTYFAPTTAGIVVLATGVLTFAVVLLWPLVTPAAPTVAWNPTAVMQVVATGDTRTVSVSFTASMSAENVALYIVPELRPFLQVTPERLPIVAAGQSVTVQLTFIADGAVAPGIYKGTLQLRSASAQKIFAKPLPVVVNVVGLLDDSVINAGGGYAFTLPPDYTFDAAPETFGSTVVLPPGQSVDTSEEYIGDIVIRTVPNPSELELQNFYEQPDQTNLFLVAETVTPLSVNGFEAVRFGNIPGMQSSSVAAVRLPGRVVEVTDVANIHQDDGVFTAIVESLQAY
jgi:hypothetical protein